MSEFRAQLRLHSQAAAAEADEEGDRAWIYVAYDQLTCEVGPLSRLPPTRAGIVLVESSWKAARRPYHKHKLALLLANMRHFALEQARRGVKVEYIHSSEPYDVALRETASRLGTLVCMEPAERELRQLLEPLALEGLVDIVPNECWLTTTDDFEVAIKGRKTWRMDSFYRVVRKRTGLLMDGETPLGGKFSFDAENREFWPGDPPAPTPPPTAENDITSEVIALVRDTYAHHPGEIRPDALHATAGDIEGLWQWALRECMPHFGPYEDAMSARSTGLFHTRISALLNLGRMLPSKVVNDVANLDIPLQSKEGFIRQVLGWREFVRHIHQRTDGFRDIPEGTSQNVGGDATPNHLEMNTPLPAAFWNKPSGLRCLDRVVTDVWDEAYSHHISRLMVLSNIASLLDVNPRELTDWFWIAYADAYDWVVEPNVLAMGTFATGDLMTTKPYVSGSRYIDSMSDYCQDCQFDPDSSCPLKSMYWAYLERHRGKLANVPRMRLALASAAKRSEKQADDDAAVFEWARDTLGRGQALSADGHPVRAIEKKANG